MRGDSPGTCVQVKTDPGETGFSQTRSVMQPHEYKVRKMLGTPDAAAYCGSSVSSFTKFRLYGDGPVYVKIGRRVVYDPADLDRWLASHRRHSTSDVTEAA
jgi:predicted DNA-binding transcriptional regulator AlpA